MFKHKVLIKFTTLFALAVVTASSFALDIMYVRYTGKGALVRINDRPILLKKGKTTHHGVTLISADKGQAVVQVKDQWLAYAKGSNVGKNVDREVKIKATALGMYEGQGKINGKPAKYLIDTGATYVSMGKDHARRLKVKYKKSDKRVSLRTANGVVKGYLVNLSEVTLGHLTLTNVKGVVSLGKHGDMILLGGSFLNQLQVTTADGVMILSEK